MGPEQSSIAASPSPELHLDAIVFLLCSFSALIGIIALAGWWSHMPMLVGINGMASMKPNTAVTVLLLALAVIAKQIATQTASQTANQPARQPSQQGSSPSQPLTGLAARVAAVLAIGALLLTLATLLEYATGRSLGIDQLLAQAPLERSGDPLGRMSRGTALDGLFTAIALLTLETGTRNTGTRNTSPRHTSNPDTGPLETDNLETGNLLSALLGAFALLLSLSAVVGFVFDAGALLGARWLRSMAPRTALAFLAMQLAYFLLRPDREPLRSLLRSARFHRSGTWFVLGTCIIPLLIGWPIASLYRRGWFEAPFAFAVLVVLLMAAQAFLVSRNSRSLATIEDKRLLVEGERIRLAAANQRQYADLVASQEHAAQSEAQYRLITDMLPSLIAYLDRDLRYVRLNRTYEQWFGLPAAEMEGRPIADVLGPSTDSVLPHLLQALNGEPQRFETSLQTLHGDRTVAIAHMPDKDSNGDVRGVIVQAEDITNRKREEAALRQAEKLAAVGKLASSIAHEINNPLESVTNLLYLAGSSDNLAEVQEFIAVAEGEVRRVSAIANQTLRFHKQSTRPVRVTAEELFDAVLTIYQGRLRSNRIEVANRYRATTPVLCLDGEIRQVLNNLVGNAIDALEGPSGKLFLRSRDAIDWRTGRAGLALTVADTGSGMSAATLASLFEAFYTTKGQGGTGLGLWVSKEIVDRHGGRLHVRSSQGHGTSGTVFQLFLPHAPAIVA